MKIVGIVGGVASGKSTVAGMFLRHGAGVIDADEIGHRILREPDIIQALTERWGSELINSQGDIDRRRLAAAVFRNDGNREGLEFLEQLTHPQIKSRVLSEINRLQADGVELVVLDAALLLEVGWNSICQKIVFVDASADVRKKHAARRQWTEQELFRRESQQLSPEEKRSVADFVIPNNGSIETLREEISRVWDSLTEPEMAD